MTMAKLSRGIDILDTINLISRLSRKYQAIVLNDLQGKLYKDDFIAIRKTILDSFNEFAREVAKAIFYDVE
jgi:hypothetical protein